MRKNLQPVIKSAYKVDSHKSMQGILEITWGDGRESKFHHRWLLDNCRCATCISPTNFQRQTSYPAPAQMVVSNIQLRQKQYPNGPMLNVTWQDYPHRSLYAAQWLREHTYSNPDIRTQQPALPVVKTWQGQQQPATIAYCDLMQQLVIFDNRRILQCRRKRWKLFATIPSLTVQCNCAATMMQAKIPVPTHPMLKHFVTCWMTVGSNH